MSDLGVAADAATKTENYNVIQLTTMRSSNNSSSNGTGIGELYDVTPGVIFLLSLLYGVISVVSVIGNALVILVIAKNKVMQTVTNFFIANLSVADVMIGIFSIPFQFQAALLQRWDLPRIMCPVAPFVKELTVTVSILTLTVISIDRYFAVIQPLRPRCSSRVARTTMAAVWIFSLCSSIPVAITFEVSMIPDDRKPGNLKPFCASKFPTWGVFNTGSIYRLYTLLIQYFLPLIILSCAYGMIIHRIWLTKTPGCALDSRDQMLNRNKRKVIKMLLIVVALFAFCWLPLQVYRLSSEIHQEINDYKYINIIWFCFNWLAMSNSCYNPFIYGLLNEKFKRAFRVLFIRCPCVKRDTKVQYPDHSVTDETRRKSSSSGPDDPRYQVNCGRVRGYVRVNGIDMTEQSFV